MRPHREESEGPAWVARISEVVRTVASGEVSEGAGLESRERFLATVARHRRPRSVPGMAWGGTTILAAGAAAAHLFQPASATDGVERRAPGNGYVSGGPGSHMVRFPSGPSVELAPGAGGRVGDEGTARAHVVLEGGRATVRGAAHPQHDVLIEAGPYAVTSRGAHFDVSWSGEAIEVHVALGTVTVTGPSVSQGITLYENQSFVAREAAWELRCF